MSCFFSIRQLSGHVNGQYFVFFICVWLGRREYLSFVECDLIVFACMHNLSEYDNMNICV